MANADNLARGWQEAYCQSEPWNFLLGVDILGSEAWVGVMVPSFDSVGRCFPLTITSTIKISDTTANILNPRWFTLLAQAALKGISQGISPAQLDEEFISIEGKIADQRFSTSDTCENLDNQLIDATTHVLSDSKISGTLWWRNVGKALSPFYRYDGLPEHDNANHSFAFPFVI